VATLDDVGEIYHGYDNRWGHVRVTPAGDGYIYIDVPVDDDVPHDDFLRGIVTSRGDIYEGHYTRKVGIVSPPLDVERMGAAALLLGLLSSTSQLQT
jgi:hypothetical protein